MALQLVSLKRVEQPLRNTHGVNNLFDDRQRISAEQLYYYIRKTPEMVAMLDTLVTDHFMGPVDFFDANGKPLGPTKLKKVQTMWENLCVQHDAFYGQGLDYFTDGSSFGWHANASGILTAKQKETISKIKAVNADIGKFTEEQLKTPRVVSYLAASTTEIKHDEQDVLYYVQDAAGERVRWDKDQVVHIKLMDWNGEYRGYSPMKALLKEIYMMYMLKDNIMAALQNGGSPDYIISLVGGGMQSKARFQRLRSALESFSHLRKSHGNMPIDADVKVHELGTKLRDMEYRELAMFIISEFALALGLPTSRVPFLMTGSGGASNKGELSGNSEDSYQAKINTRRTQWENAWNKVFREAGFTFKFRRTNLQDSVRETQASVQRAAYVTNVQTSLQKSSKRLKLSSHLALLSGSKMNLDESDIEDIPKDELAVFGMGAPMGGIGTNMQARNVDSKSKVSQDKSAAKEKTAFNNERYR